MDSNEIFDIVVSVIAISVAFSIGTIQTETSEISKAQFFPVILLTVGVGFVAHELAHRFVANHYGAQAHFKAWPEGLLLMFALAVISNGQFLFAAPGAVYIYANYLTRRENGIISIAGALVNCVLAGVFFIIALTAGAEFAISGNPTALSLAGAFMYFGTYTNLYLAFFNMIPIPPLDGSKVITWNFWIWGAFVLLLLITLGFLGF